jgi:ubiquinone/menaquinone biosynthesis C-methylase UbiE
LNNVDSDDHRKIKSFYDNIYYKGVTANNTPSRHHLQLAAKLQVNSSSRVLDVACGLGEFLAACSQRGAQVAGVDLSENAIRVCKTALPEGIFHACSAEQLPFDTGAFDLVTCLGSLEHFLDPKSAIKEMLRVAKADASFVILVPNKDFLTRRLGLYSGTYQVDAKEDVRTLDEWNTLFESAGLKVHRRWKDLHVLSWKWISTSHWYVVPLRAAQAISLTIWPLRWQYQVFHLAKAN